MTGATPAVSFVIPTLNAERYLESCLTAIRAQDYPQDHIEIVIADGGSSDRTIEIAEYFGARVVPNSLRTGEAGKAAGFRAARAPVLAFIDSDNEIVGADWLTRMMKPFEDASVVSSEVIYWAYVHEDGIVNRYCALTGINDPTSLFVGNYGRWSWLKMRWTDYPVRILQMDGWEKVTLSPSRVPTMGANGYLVRAAVLNEMDGVDKYFFDIDVVQGLAQMGHTTIARVPTEIRHQFAVSTKDYARKTRRRARDYLAYRGSGQRSYAWPRAGIVKFTVASVLVVPLLLQALRGYRNRPDPAWLYHPVACWMTLGVYAESVLRRVIDRSEYDRSGWKQ